MGLYGSFRYGPSFEHRQTGLAPCGYGNGDGKVTLAELQTYLDDEMTYQARRRHNRDQKASVQGKLDSVLATLREVPILSQYSHNKMSECVIIRVQAKS